MIKLDKYEVLTFDCWNIDDGEWYVGGTTWQFSWFITKLNDETNS